MDNKYEKVQNYTTAKKIMVRSRIQPSKTHSEQLVTKPHAILQKITRPTNGKNLHKKRDNGNTRTRELAWPDKSTTKATTKHYKKILKTPQKRLCHLNKNR